MALENEMEIYRQKRAELVADGYLGKFVVIKDEEVFDVFLTYEDALRQGLKRYGNVPFLVKEISHFEQINFFFHGVDLPCHASV